MGQEYQISVWHLPDYATSEKRHPVVYLLDADFSMGMAVDNTRWLVFAQEVPEVIIVGIGYNVQSYEDFSKHRLRDYTPTPEFSGSGGAEKFFQFLESELIPFIDANYRTDPTNRSLWGYSLGGLFAVYALFQKPTLFQRYICGTPALNWDDQFMLRFAREMADKPLKLQASVYISVGTEGSMEIEMATPIDDFVNILRHRNDNGLNLQTEIFNGETHFSGFSRLFVRGMKALF